MLILIIMLFVLGLVFYLISKPPKCTRCKTTMKHDYNSGVYHYYECPKCHYRKGI